MFLAILCNVPNMKRWDIPRMHVRRGVLLLGSTIVATDRIQVLLTDANIRFPKCLLVRSK